MTKRIYDTEFLKLFKMYLDQNISLKDLIEFKNNFPDAIRYKDIINIEFLFNQKRQYSKKSKESIRKNPYLYENYREILEKTTALAKELKLKNSLEFCNLFTYLLWNGYFSRDRRLVFQSDGRKSIKGMYALDIMSGIGVCTNFSDMLKDFLNTSGFKSASLINTYNHNIQKTYTPDINRPIGEFKKSSELLRKFIILISPSCTNGNHIFNLIKEDSKFYIYDSTNLLLLQPENIHTAKVINGVGKINLNPYYSYSMNYLKKENAVLDSFLKASDYTSPYDKTIYKLTTKQNMQLFKSNESLLSDYYNWAEENIENIANTLALKKNK